MAALFEAFCRAFFQSPSPELNWSTLMCKLPRRKNNYPGMHRWDAKHLPNVYFSPPRWLQTLSITSQTLALAQTLQVTLWIKNTYNPYPGPPGHGNRLGACGPLESDVSVTGVARNPVNVGPTGSLRSSRPGRQAAGCPPCPSMSSDDGCACAPVHALGPGTLSVTSAPRSALSHVRCVARALQRMQDGGGL